MKATRIQLIGKSGRLDCMAEALAASPSPIVLSIVSEVDNPSLSSKGTVIRGDTTDHAFIEKCARQFRPDLAVIGPEEPLEAGVVDRLKALGIPSVGPTKSLARLESSKSFTRSLLAKYRIPGNPEHRVFHSLEGIRDYANNLKSFVVKPDGLTGGKGVKVFGEHLSSVRAALRYCEQLFDFGQPAVLIEEKLDGEEFSFQSFFDGKHIAHTVPVQDHKRARSGDKGANTGGMGSYSCADHLLPFLSRSHVRQAAEINRLVGEALLRETGQPYKGILYGGFMLTKRGLRVIEYNARFGDPEVMNVLPIMEADFVAVCRAMVEGTLDRLTVRLRRQATVCKYVVPKGYPNAPLSDTAINVDAATAHPSYGQNLRIYYGAVEGRGRTLRMTGSRAVALLGIGDTLQDAERLAETAARSIIGDVYHRRDVGTAKLVQKRIDHMRLLTHPSRSGATSATGQTARRPSLSRV